LVGAIVSDEYAAPFFRANFPAGNMEVARYLETMASVPNKRQHVLIVTIPLNLK